jgi:hypothetical protein
LGEKLITKINKFWLLVYLLYDFFHYYITFSNCVYTWLLLLLLNYFVPFLCMIILLMNITFSAFLLIESYSLPHIMSVIMRAPYEYDNVLFFKWIDVHASTSKLMSR